MDKLFVSFFLPELRKAGFPKVLYIDEQKRVSISPEYIRFFVTYEDGEYLIHYDANSRHLVPIIKSVLDNTRSVTAAWSSSKPSEIAGAEQFRKLLQWNDIMLAARYDGEHGLYFVTWRYDNDRQGVNKQDPISGRITQVALTWVDGEGILPDIWYDVDLKER